MKKMAFDLFRYQILPKDRSFQPDMFDGIKTPEELLEKKNQLFAEVLKNIRVFETFRSAVNYRLIYDRDDSYLYQFAANRSIKRETEEFTEEELQNWPSFLVFIWNDPSKQLIVIQERQSAFQRTDVVAKAITEAINNELGKKNLRVHFETIFLEKAFWDLASENRGKIKDIKFELITPNMANISEVLSDELKEFAKNSNTAQTNIDIISDPDSSIIPDPEDHRMKGLVKYASEGGGDISLKLRGISRRIHTKQSKKRVDIDEAIITGNNPDEIVAALKAIIANDEIN